MTTSMETMELSFTRTIAASPVEVYDAWLDPKCPVNPFCGAQRLCFEPKVGALYHFTSQKPGQIPRPHYGRFEVLERGAKIEMTWMSNHTRGLESIVTVSFVAKGRDTILTLRHANLPKDEMGETHDIGWKLLLGKLEQRFAGAGASTSPMS